MSNPFSTARAATTAAAASLVQIERDKAAASVQSAAEVNNLATETAERERWSTTPPKA